AALPGLFARKMSGWRLLFYAQIVSLMFSLLSGNIIGAIIGGLSAVHQFVRIGEHCIIGGMSGVSQDVPPYVTAVVSRPQRGYALYGLNLIGLRRNRFSPETVAALKQAFKIIFRAEVPLKEALARAEAELPPLPEVRHLIAFVRESKRGVLR
ncbi:MAG TPA: hypothetical protein PKV70_05825, partial [Thermodesulfobacteriota bacterium]|nr:hypothetical protein [Thermodesulfobacteriota bacterium]